MLEKIINNRKIYDGMTLKERMEHYNVPGLSLAIIDNFKIDCAYATGTEKYSEDRPITRKTLFQSGSISKHVFATMVLKLCEEEILDLDKNINNYLKDIVIKNIDGEPCDATLRQLLTHTGGFSVGGFEGYKKGESIPNILSILKGEIPANSDEVIQEIQPNKEFRYSGGGFMVAEKILMDIMECNCETFMKKHILKPMGMESSTYGDPETLYACGHTYNNSVIVGDFHIMPEKAAAGLWSNPTELAMYGIQLQKIINGEKGILQKNTIDMMSTPQVRSITFEVEDTIGQVGLGCFVKDSDENIRFGHSGWNEGYVSLMNFYKYKGCGLVVMLNSNEGEPLLYEIQRAVTESYQW